MTAVESDAWESGRVGEVTFRGLCPTLLAVPVDVPSRFGKVQD